MARKRKRKPCFLCGKETRKRVSFSPVLETESGPEFLITEKWPICAAHLGAFALANLHDGPQALA